MGSGNLVSVPDIAERLMIEFGGAVDLSVISQIVLRCCRDLRGIPAATAPELVERLARQDLLDTV